MRYHFLSRRGAWALALTGAALLSGCASGPRHVQSQVQSYASMAGVQLPTTYRLELLPSQNQQPSFARIEAAAQQSLQRVGLTRAPQPERARLVVQVSATATQGRFVHPAYGDGFYGPRFGFGMGFGGPRMGLGMHWMDTPPMVHYRAIQLVLRDPQTQQIVYETSAAYDEVWMDDQLIWSILFDAALTGFPHPPAGPRTVRSTVMPVAATSSPTAAPATPVVR